MKKWGRFAFWVIVLVALDQWTKYLAKTGLSKNIVIIPGVFELQYVENQGAAFGILQNQLAFFVIFTLIMGAVILLVYRHIPEEKGYGWIRLSTILIFSGAIGNLIDRVMNRYVVDFLYFKPIDFPTFNVADSYVVVGAISFVLLYFIQKKKVEEVLNKLERKKKSDDGNLADQ